MASIRATVSRQTAKSGKTINSAVFRFWSSDADCCCCRAACARICARATSFALLNLMTSISAKCERVFLPRMQKQKLLIVECVFFRCCFINIGRFCFVVLPLHGAKVFEQRWWARRSSGGGKATAAMMMKVESALASRDDRDRRASTRAENRFSFRFLPSSIVWRIFFCFRSTCSSRFSNIFLKAPNTILVSGF